ncbi:hypothetical protein Tco_0143094 [Tanacetum coccineum]
MESSTSSKPNHPYSPVNPHGSTPVNNDVEDDSPVEEVSPVKPKKPSRRIARAKKDDPKEPPKDWTVRKRSRCAKLGAMCLKIILKETV